MADGRGSLSIGSSRGYLWGTRLDAGRREPPVLKARTLRVPAGAIKVACGGTNVTGCQPLQESLAAVEIAGWGRDWMHTYSIQGAGRREPPLPCVLKVRSL